MKSMVVGVGDDASFPTMSAAVDIRVANAEEFAATSGVRILPFSLVIARGGDVLAAGPGLPDAPFVRDAAEQFVVAGSAGSTKFRRISSDVNAKLLSLESTFSTRLPAR
jgi:hypothetical protein